MPRTSFAMSVCFLALCLVGGGARADEDRGVDATSQPSPYPPAGFAVPSQPQPWPHPVGSAPRLHPQACATLCRMFEFLGALERPTPPKPIPTS